MPKLVTILALLCALVSSASAQPLPPNPGTGLPPITHVDATYRNLGSSVLTPGQCITVGSGPTFYLQSTGSACGSGGGGGGISAGVGIVLTGGGTIVNLINPVAASLGGTGVSSPTAHELLITEGSSAMNLLGCLSNQAVFGVTGSDPTCRAISLADLPNSGVVAGSYTSTNLTVNAQGIITAASNGSGGGGSVTSVGLTVPAYESVSGSPVTGAGTLAVSLNNENAHLFFAGPVSGSAASPTFRLTDPSDVLGSSINPANDGSTGTTVNKLASLTSAAAAIITTAGTTSGAVGICIQNCGTTGNSYIQQNGQQTCVFDGPTTANDAVGISASVNGDCTDLGSPIPTVSAEIIGTVTSTNGGAGTYNVDLFTPDLVQATAVNNQNSILRTNASTGPTLNKLVSLDTSTEALATIAPTSAQTGILGICVAGCAAASNATVRTFGSATCVFDNATTNGDVFIPSTSTAGDCHDTGSANNYNPGGGSWQSIGTVNGTHGGAGTYAVTLRTNAGAIPQTIGGISICDNATLEANAGTLFRVISGSGILQVCNGPGSNTTIGGAYTWNTVQTFSATNALETGTTGSHIWSHNNSAGGTTTPTLTSCGSGSVVAHSTDIVGDIIATGATSCTVNFVTAYTRAICTVSDVTTAGGIKVTTSNSSAFTVSGFTSGDEFVYHCYEMN